MLKARSFISASKSVLSCNRKRGLATSSSLEWAKALNKPLKETDPEVHAIIESEKVRQKDSLVLIASENFTSLSVFDALGSVMSNKYSEGYPGARYYGGNENIDKMELLCQQRALDAFNLVRSSHRINFETRLCPVNVLNSIALITTTGSCEVGCQRTVVVGLTSKFPILCSSAPATRPHHVFGPALWRTSVAW